jgi:hypothetical protein
MFNNMIVEYHKGAEERKEGGKEGRRERKERKRKEKSFHIR